MALEELIALVNSKGFKVTNLYQLEEGWQANLRTGPSWKCDFFEFGLGATAVEALQTALDRAENPTSRRHYTAPPPVMNVRVQKPEIDIFS